MVPPFPNPASSSSSSSGAGGFGKRVGPIVPKSKKPGRPWWWDLVPIKPNAQGKPDLDDVADWLEAAIPFL